MIDTEQGRIIDDEEIKNEITSSKPYGKWLKEHHISLIDLPEIPAQHCDEEQEERLLRRQQTFGYTDEDEGEFIAPDVFQRATGPIRHGSHR